jgi:hypothetical protein
VDTCHKGAASCSPFIFGGLNRARTTEEINVRSCRSLQPPEPTVIELLPICPRPFETFVHVYEEQLKRRYGFWRPYLQKVIYRYLDCSDLHNRFDRVKANTPSFLEAISNVEDRVNKFKYKC